MKKLYDIMKELEIYHQYKKVKEVMEPYFKRWNEVDANMGK